MNDTKRGTVSQYDYELTDRPVCPHCGNVETDHWELGLGYETEVVETWCNACGKPIMVSIQITEHFRCWPGKKTD